ncbi:MAG: succinylglutamate desuccinylase/aspartoacylase family protein [Alphaproteobacteria bacterium]|nr:succinylglutamate desuccinylase/aspartoacylase family protein [Alphaproteobacteria bacterium]
MLLKKYVFTSPPAGPKVLFLGGVHGNETCGVKALFKVIEKFASRALTLNRGSVEFIPVCNPQAHTLGLRQVEENLNRVVKNWDTPTTYEQHLGKELSTHIRCCDIVIDLHSSHCPQDKPFIFDDYPTAASRRLSQAQNIIYIIEGWPQIYRNAPIADFSTGSCAQTYGKTCLTVECGYHQSLQSEQTAYYVVLNTLLCLNMLDGFPSAPLKQQRIMMDEIIVKSSSGNLTHPYHHLDKISRGEILAVYDNNTNIICPQDGFILLPNAKAAVNTEWFYLGHLLEPKVVS